MNDTDLSQRQLALNEAADFIQNYACNVNQHGGFYFSYSPEKEGFRKQYADAIRALQPEGK